MKPYPKYRDSGVEWIGEIPEHWQVTQLKHQTDFINGCAFKPDTWADDGVPIIRIENLNGGEDFNRFKGEVAERFHVKQGDLLFAWSGNIGTSFGPFLWEKDGLFYLNQHIFRLAGYRMQKTFFFWLLKALTRYVESQAHGIIGMVHVTRGELGGTRIPEMTPAEQSSIAGFIDAKTAEVDELIEKKRRQIELLKEYRASVISEAVTKGLNPNVRMKDSGVEWIGQIPEHWSVCKVKHVAESLQTGPFGSQLHSEEYVEDGIPLVNPAHMSGGCIVPDRMCSVSATVFQRLSRHRLNAGDVVFARRGELGRCALVTAKEDGWLCGTGSIRLRLLLDKVNPAYLIHFLGTPGVGQSLSLESVGTTMENLNTGIIAGLWLCLPPLSEQTKVTEHIVETSRSVDLLTSTVMGQIEQLQSYRTSLISEAVTGKIDVRDWARAS